MSLTRTGLILLALLWAVPAVAQPSVFGGLTVTGDLRTGYFGSHRHERTGSSVDRSDLRARLRIGAGMQISEALALKLRVAGRFSTNQESFDFYVRDHAPTADGLRLGEATIDEAYVNYRPSERVNLRAGRFQSKFALADLMGKSLDRGDSPNTDITWTDGLHVTISPSGGWNAHLVLQHNAAEGATNMARSPLDFSDSRSRVTWFGALESSSDWGPVVQRSLDLTYIPGAWRVGGDTENYVALVARGTVATDVAAGRLLVGLEGGYAPNTPLRATMQLDDAERERTGGIAFQIAVTLANAIEGHRFGIVYGEAQAGWLLSPDFRNNDRLFEGRYQWQFARHHSLEARLRFRQDLERHIGAEHKRKDMDFYLRITSRF